MPSKEFHQLLNRCKEIHDKKSHDYAQDDNPFSNFERAAEIVSWFNNPIDQVFAGILGIKLSRAAELLNGKTPKNESLSDTMVDGTNYFGLWGAYYIRRENDNHLKSEEKKQYLRLHFDETLYDNTVREMGKLAGVECEQGRAVREKISEQTGFLNICSQCENAKRSGCLVELNHAVTMHSAILNKAQGTLKYPNHPIILLKPEIISAVIGHLRNA